MKRLLLALLVTLAFAAAAHAQNPTPANIRCWNGSAWVSCPLSDGGAGAITTNTTRITLGGEPCSGTKLPFSVSISSATTTQLIAASSGNKVYICSLHIGPISTANNIALVEDDTVACATPTNGLTGGTTAATGMQFPASGGSIDGGSNSSIIITTNANRYVCAITSSTSVTAVWGTYVLAP